MGRSEGRGGLIELKVFTAATRRAWTSFLRSESSCRTADLKVWTTRTPLPLQSINGWAGHKVATATLCKTPQNASALLRPKPQNALSVRAFRKVVRSAGLPLFLQ